jgi:hypothetical protein
MPRGDKSSYSSKQQRQAEHIEEGYEKRGVSKDEAERRAWATVNKETGGAKKKSSKRSTKKAGKKAASGAARTTKKAGGKKKVGRKKAASKKSR